jgi:formylglycine-generating enzyme required for sulfatase activity
MDSLRHGARLTAILLTLGISSLVSAQDRTALVIANFDYGEHQLTQVKTDAATVAEALRKEGFRVTVAENISGKELKNTVEKFARSTVTRGMAILYFAGLGGQYQTSNSEGALRNHLQGAGKPQDSRNPEREFIPLPDIVKLLSDHSACTCNLVILDAAGTNPFFAGRTNQPSGLAAVQATDLPSDTAVLLAATPNVTLEQPSQLGAAFAKHLPRGRESVDKVLTAIIDEVRQKSGVKQVPTATKSKLVATASWELGANELFLETPLARDGERPGQHWINSAGMVFCWCPPGQFLMGKAAQDGQADFEDAKPVEVTLTSGFWIGKYEITQLEAERLKVGAGRYPFPGKHYPLHMIQQGQASKLLSALNDQERKAGRLPDGWEYALPTEAEWEYACRAGTTTRYAFGDDESQLCRHANYADRSLLESDGAMQFADARFDDGFGKALAPIGSYQPNMWGLHDMHGNVAEWCLDRYLPQLPGGENPRIDEKNKAAAPAGIIRGGSWCSTAEYCESAFRNSEFSGGNAKGRDYIGFRLVLRKK